MAINNINDAWQGKTGAEVREVVQRTMNEKVASVYFDAVEMKLYGFKSVEDRDRYITDKDASLIIDICPFNFTGTQNRIVIENKMPSTQLYFTTNQTEAIVTVGFKSEEKGITDAEWQDKTEDFLVTVAIDKGSQGGYVNIKTDELVLNGKILSVDIRQLLIAGSNRLKITAKGADSGAVSSLVYNITLTSMYLASSKFTWYAPFIEGQSYALGGLNIGGNLQKVLKLRVTKEGYEKLYEVNIGSNTYTSTAYYFNDLEFPSAGSGVYNVEMWLDANGLESDHLNYNIICVRQADQYTAKLVCLSESPKKVYNFADNKLFEYAIYNGGATTGSPHIKVVAITNTNPSIIVDEELANVTTSAPLSYVLNLEVEAEEAQLQLDAILTYGNEQQVILPIDNSKSFPATSGASFYFNPSTRNNAQANREAIINAINSTAYNAEWLRMAWTDGADGYTTDDEGRKCLRLPAMSMVGVEYQPMKQVKAKTIEFVYKVKNASDYNEPIITICDDRDSKAFKGIKITPKNILLHSRDLNTADSLQDYNTIDEEVMHVIITIIPNYKTNYGNLAQIYVNGAKCRSFEFASTDSWLNDGYLIFGSQTADLYIYKMRVYEQGFDKIDAMRNYVNSMPTAKDKEELTAWLEECVNDNYALDYDTCVKNGLNTMVIEMLDGATLPDLLHQSGGKCNVTIDVKDIPQGEIDDEMRSLLSGTALLNQDIEGQGTTAMTYYRWNFRWKLSSAYNKRRITAKKNVASSMHSHKMGATRLYNYLYKECVGANEANADVAVTQYPVFGFLKVKVEGTKDQYTYQPIGLYTVGADKGDKKTFGYDKAEFTDSLIHLEGADHTPKGVGYDYPYAELQYSAGIEAIGAVNASGEVVGAYEVGACGNNTTDDAGDVENIKAMLDREFKPAYEIAYNCSPFVLAVPETLEQINADVEGWRAKTQNGISYEQYEFYTYGDYNLYYYDIKEKKYKPNGVNVYMESEFTQDDVYGKTDQEINQLIIERRKEFFVKNWSRYWNTQDVIFTYTFLLIMSATDNFKKNTYPQKFKPLSEGGRWGNRQDDLDTIFDITNQGQSGKSYSVLVGDTTTTGSVFRGDNSVLWTLVRETQQAEIKAMAIKIFDAMCAKAKAVGYGNGSTREQLIGCIKHYFWNNAQAYFPPSAYNADAEWTYEDAWVTEGAWKEVNPLNQALGSHYEAERDYVAMRMLFLASYFNYGAFRPAGYNDTSEGQMVYGGADAHTFEITPAVDMNPTIIIGQSGMESWGGRADANETIDVAVPSTSGADTRIYVQGLDWIKDIGDLSTLKVGEGNANLSVASKRLQSLKVGDEDASKVTSNIQQLNFGACPSMLIVDARNLSSLTGNVDLRQLPRLISAYLGGTQVKSVQLANGSKVAHLQVPDSLTTLNLLNLKFLEELDYNSLGNVQFFRMEGCDKLDSFALLKEQYNADASQLKDVRVIGFVYDGDANDVDMLANIVNDKDKNGNEHHYNGIDSENNILEDSNPIIEGTLNVAGSIYEDAGNVVKAYYPNLTLNVQGGYYIRFADAEVQRVLMANGVGDGVGIRTSDVEAVTSIGQWFKGNTVIESFDELEKFTGVTSISSSAFAGCSKLTSIDLSNIKSTAYGSFLSLASLNKIVLRDLITVGERCFGDCANAVFVGGIPTSIETIESSAFNGCLSLTGDLYLPNLTNIGNQASFVNCDLSRILSLGTNTSLGGANFQNNKNMEVAILPVTHSRFGWNVFAGCSKLSVLIILAEIPPIISEMNNFNGTPIISGTGCFYVPDASLTAYKEATNWNTYASRIKGISALATDNAELYEEIKDYLN